MINSKTLAVLTALLVPTVTIAQEGKYPEPSGNFTGVGTWRSIAPWHYYSGECCYCLEATKIRPSKSQAGETEFLVQDVWWSMPNIPDTRQTNGKPVDFYMICDPVQRKYTCIIPGFAG